MDLDEQLSAPLECVYAVLETDVEMSEDDDIAQTRAELQRDVSMVLRETDQDRKSSGDYRSILAWRNAVQARTAKRAAQRD